jgi:curved DNA-binding protein CbpA
MRDPGELELSRGRLNELPLAALLLSARRRAATGLLSIEAGQGTSRLFLRDGAPCFAQVAVGYRPLGQVLVQYGLVDLEAFDRALPQLEKGRPLTEVLLEARAIDEGGLAEGLRMQLVEHLRALAALKDGAWEFKEQPLPTWASPVALVAESAVAVALESPAAEPLVLSLLAAVGPRLIKLKDGSDPLLGALDLAPEERSALEALREGGGPESLEARGLAPPKARWLAALLLALGAAEPFDPRPEARAQAEEEARRRLEDARARAEAAARALEEQAHQEAQAQRRRASELQARLEEEERARQTEAERRRAAEEARKAAEAQARQALEQAVAERARLREETEGLVETELRRADEEAARILERLVAEAQARAQIELDQAQAEASQAEEALTREQAALHAESEACQLAQAGCAEQEARLAAALAEAERIVAEANEHAAQERARIATECRTRIDQLEQSQLRGASDDEQRLLEEAKEKRAQALAMRDELGRLELSIEAARREREELGQKALELEARARAADEKLAADRVQAAALVEAAQRGATEQARVEEQEAKDRVARMERERAEAEEVARRAAEEARLEAERLARELAERKERAEREERERAEAEVRRREQEVRAAEAEERARQQAQELAFARQAAANASQELVRRRAFAAERLEREARELLVRGAERRRADEEAPSPAALVSTGVKPSELLVHGAERRQADEEAPSPAAAALVSTGVMPSELLVHGAERRQADEEAPSPAAAALVSTGVMPSELRGATEALGQEDAAPEAVAPLSSLEAAPELQSPALPVEDARQPIPLTQAVGEGPIEVDDTDIVAAPPLAATEPEASVAAQAGEGEAALPPGEPAEPDAALLQQAAEEEAAARERLFDARERTEERRLGRLAQARELAEALKETPAPSPLAREPQRLEDVLFPGEAPQALAASPTIDLDVEDIAELGPQEAAPASVALEQLAADLALPPDDSASPVEEDAASAQAHDGEWFTSDEGETEQAADPVPPGGLDWEAEAARPTGSAVSGAEGAAYVDVEFEPPPPITLGGGEVVRMEREAGAGASPAKVEGAVVEGTGYLEQAVSLTASVELPDSPALDDLFPGDPPSSAAAQSEIASAIEALSSQESLTQDVALDPLQFASPEQARIDLSLSPFVHQSGAQEPSPPPESSPWLAPPEGEPSQGEPSPSRVQPESDGAASWNAALADDPLGGVGEEHAGALLESPAGEDEALTEEDKLRRQRLLRRSFDNLGALSRSPPPESSAPASPSPTSSGVASAPPGASGPLSPEDQVLAARVEARAASIVKEDLFVRLGLARSAGREQVKNAYLSAVMIFHPDRLPQTLGHLSPKMQLIFAAISDAHDTLGDDIRRATYLRQLDPGSGGSAGKGRSEEVEVLERQAEVALRKKEFTGAAELYGRAFAISKSASHLAQEAWSIYLDPEQRSNLAGVKRMLEQALKMDNACDRASYSLGVIARVEGELDKAEKLFRAALHSNPKNAEASTELRLIEMRRKKPSGKKGLFG